MDGIDAPQYDSLGTLKITLSSMPPCNKLIAPASLTFSPTLEPCSTTATSTWAGNKLVEISRSPPQCNKPRNIPIARSNPHNDLRLASDLTRLPLPRARAIGKVSATAHAPPATNNEPTLRGHSKPGGWRT